MMEIRAGSMFSWPILLDGTSYTPIEVLATKTFPRHGSVENHVK